MKKIFSLLLIFIAAKSFAQTADDIVNKYIAATGGTEKWSKVISLKFTGTYQMGPGMQAPLMAAYLSKPFKGSYSDFSWQGMTSKTAIRADSGWSYNPFGVNAKQTLFRPKKFVAINWAATRKGFCLTTSKRAIQ